jgi:hypothetical protein
MLRSKLSIHLSIHCAEHGYRDLTGPCGPYRSGQLDTAVFEWSRLVELYESAPLHEIVTLR